MRLETGVKDTHQFVKIGYFSKVIKEKEEKQMLLSPLWTHSFLYNFSLSIYNLFLNGREFKRREKSKCVHKLQPLSSQPISRCASMDVIVILQV